MRSAPSQESSHDVDRTARARIRDAAVERFAAHGVKGTSLKAIAEDSGVSPALVVHHFGSKEGLRRACDEHVATSIREQKRAAMAEGPQLDPLATIRSAAAGTLLLRYLARTIGDGTAHVVALIDEMVDDAVAYSEEGVREGVLRPSEDPRARAAVLVLWSLGILTLHEHAERLLGVDLTADGTDVTPYLRPAVEIMGQGVLTEGMHERFVGALDRQREDGE